MNSFTCFQGTFYVYKNLVDYYYYFLYIIWFESLNNLLHNFKMFYPAYDVTPLAFRHVSAPERVHFLSVKT